MTNVSLDPQVNVPLPGGALPESAEDEAANAALCGNETAVTNNGDSKLLTRDEIIVGVENLQERLTLSRGTPALFLT